MTMAEEVLKIVHANGWSAITLEGGYGITSWPEMNRVLWEHIPKPTTERELRNREERVTKVTYRYPDQSAIHFTWSEHNGPRWRYVKP